MNFDTSKCEQRNRIAARRDGVNAFPFAFLNKSDLPTFLPQQGDEKYPSQWHEDYAPRKAAEEQVRTKHDGEVYIHYMEAANSNFIPDRFMFLGDSTLKNIARDAEAGFSFMNSHRTGSLSHPSELPFGQTFYGKNENKDGRNRSVVGIYMLPGIQPNGANGPSTDDLNRMIEAGTVKDVSVGLYGGWLQCDVCGQDLFAYDNEADDYSCPHVPGSTYKMTASEIKAQKTRGVPDGKCSSTLLDARCGEVSAVYDGAVPGAGFQKALTFLKDGRLDNKAKKECKSAYARFTLKGEFETMDEIKSMLENFLSGLKETLGMKPAPAPKPAEAPAQLAADEETTLRLSKELADARNEALELKKQANGEAVKAFMKAGKFHHSQLEAALELRLSNSEAFDAFMAATSKSTNPNDPSLVDAQELENCESETPTINSKDYFAYRARVNAGKEN